MRLFFKKIISRINIWFDRRSRPGFYQFYDEYYKYLVNLFNSAASDSGLFNYMCILLRVEGITDKGWDSFTEAQESLESFSKLLRKVKRNNKKDSLRLALLMYCHATEMSEPYRILANLLRAKLNKPFQMDPFYKLVKIDQQVFPYERKLPSPVVKLGLINRYARQANDTKLTEIFSSFFDKKIRNAFYHSDYSFGEDEFRIVEGASFTYTVSLTELSEKLTKCFAFYSAFFHVFEGAKLSFLTAKKYHKWYDFRVLEVMTNPSDGLIGFKIHHPNGSNSYFTREKNKGTLAICIVPEAEGVTINTGGGGPMKTGWYVNGQPLGLTHSRYNSKGKWMPIIYPADADPILRDIRTITQDREVQNALFYIRTTGNLAIEFAVRSNQPLFIEDSFSAFTKKWIFKNNKQLLELIKIKEKKNVYVYDGTVYPKNTDVAEIVKAINIAEEFFKNKLNQGVKLTWVYKYQISRQAQPKKTDQGTLIISLKMDDPRSTLYATNPRIFPTNKWSIKEEWI